MNRREYERRNRLETGRNNIINNVRNFLNSNQTELNINFFQNTLTPLETFNSIRNILSNFINTDNNFRLLLRTNNTFITINNNTIQNFNNIYRQYTLEELENIEGRTSDEEFFYNIRLINNFNILKIRNDVNIRQGGAFFPYINKTKIDLTDLDIYNEVKKENYNDNCFIKSLLQTDIPKSKIDEIKILIHNDKIPKKDIQKICNIIKINIILYQYNKKTNNFRNIIKYWSNKDKNNNFKTYEICLYKEHYFINKKLDITSFAIKNYNEIKDLKDFNKIYKKKGKYYSRSNNNKIQSRKVVKLMFENKLFEPIYNSNELFKTKFGDKDFKLKNLDYDKNCRKIIFNPPKTPCKKVNGKKVNINYKIYYFDFETYIDEKTQEHIPYLCCCINENNNKYYYNGKDCGKHLLDYLKEDTLLIAHNSSYDLNFIIKYFYKINNIIKRGSKTISCSGIIYNKNNKLINIEVRDSSCMITMKLQDFGESFNLKQGKEVISYNSYNDYFNNKDKYFDNHYPIKKILEEFKDDKEKQQTFLENIDKWDLRRGGCIEKYYDNNGEYFDLIEYSKEYCMIDCEVLKNGYKKFREWILELCDLDIKNILTIASLSDKFFIKNGCYEGCYELNGIPRHFIQKSIVGGRCMSNDNKKYYIKNTKISDFDEVSQYPSAMYRLKGFLKGKPKLLKNNQLNYNFLKKQDDYFVEIKLLKINKKRGFSLISKINKDGVRDFNNNYKNELFVVDKTTLEDWIMYQKIDFKIIKGYYFNEGFNTKIKEVIKYMFEERKKMKKNNNPIQLVYKLIMNSAYGKTIQKPIKNKIKSFNSKKDWLKYLKINYNYVNISYNIEGSDLWYVKKVKPIINHFSRPQIGCSILSMSKRMMNEVMTTAEDNDIMIYYQDTDSIHLHTEDIPKLEKIYNKKYNKELIGKNLGQFHTDFNLKGVPKKYSGEIFSKNLIILGKKCYIDELEGKDENGNIINGFHIRMKGVPNSTIYYECNKDKINPLKLYEKLYYKEKKKFDYLEGGTKVMFNQSNNYIMKSCNDFVRTLQFL